MTLTELVSAEVFKLLQPKLPEGIKQRSIQLTKRDESDIKEHVMKDLRSLVHLLVDIIGKTYDELPYKVYGDVAKKTAKSLCFALSKRNTSVRLPMELSETLLGRLEWAFTETEYRGTAPKRFRAYMKRCWKEYQLHPDDYEAPLVQSSGFGKSRLVRELALTTSKEEEGCMGVLYTCRRKEGSTGYPLDTPTLQQWLFGADEAALIDRLVTIYIYAQEHWDDGRDKWLNLFTLQSPTIEQNLSLDYNNGTMFGVASMLPRLGVRLRASSPLASRFVADFMAVLAYTNWQNDGHVVSYASDAVVSLGAAYVWHSVEPVFRKCILPQLKKLLLNKDLVAGGAGEVEDNAVARKKIREEFEKWRSQWSDWQLGFSHFVSLELEPNEDTLWFLLGRYAAGIFPCKQNGVYLVIPMFRKSKLREKALHQANYESADEDAMGVSMILIRVADDDNDAKLDERTATELSPAYVFSPENPLHQKSCNQVIRVCMGLQESPGEFVYADRLQRLRVLQMHQRKVRSRMRLRTSLAPFLTQKS
ncbi:hypothetical protein PHYSODRAFT_502202 [Phytophthora sojae]|uniref:Uncharacterized protein n=1 Tax=Phytophthora sojae (strain P6497) TaxID=1094619 RepID=G4ZI56_PHYSP|nr:hypothetical protein PHYSODRAFT_502202 [Phytophthora sojae]EGZ18105.1 hypothetical protein PHYSODRAFT_502202 [Phytophthora sojae]|eukprot:XP_009527163.1 hypothetical protein PHYSODRAFT_502202 [Phytophthora sojae]